MQASGTRLLASIGHAHHLDLHDLAALEAEDSDPEAEPEAGNEAAPLQVNPGALVVLARVSLLEFVCRVWHAECWGLTQHVGLNAAAAPGPPDAAG